MLKQESFEIKNAWKEHIKSKLGIWKRRLMNLWKTKKNAKMLCFEYLKVGPGWITVNSLL